MRFLNMSQVNVAIEFSEKNSSLISEKDSDSDKFADSEEEVMSTWQWDQPVINDFQFDQQSGLKNKGWKTGF